MSGDVILSVTGVNRSFGGVTAVDVDHLDVARCSVVALIGPNGAGKTTFFNVLTGFERADGGTWRFDGTDLQGKQAYAIARAGMVRTFQTARVFPRLSVLDNVRLAAQDQTRRTPAHRPAAVAVATPGRRAGRAGHRTGALGRPRARSSTTTPGRSRAANASSWSWPGR